MIKNALLALLEMLTGNLLMLDGPNTQYLSTGIAAFSDAYAIVVGIAKNVCQPVAYSLLAIFLLIDLYEVSMHLYQQGGGGMAAPIAGLKTLLKLAFCKWGVDNSSEILRCIFSIAGTMTTRISTSSGYSTVQWTNDMKQYIEAADIGIFDGLVSLILLLLAVLFSWAAIIGVTYVVLSRYVQLYFYIALAPIPLSFFAEQHTAQMGIGYLKGFAGVSLQAVVITLAIRLFPAFANAIAGSIHGGSLHNYCLKIGMLCIIMLGTVLGSSQVAQRVFGG